jgi:hypothetical protein
MLALLALCALQAGCTLGPIWARHLDGRVVDARTGDPIPGATVFASFEVSGGMGFTSARTTNTRWTTTDSDGRFVLTGRFAVWPDTLAAFKNAPTVDVFHPDYGLSVTAFGGHRGRHFPGWRGLVLEVEPSVLDLDQLLENHRTLSLCHGLDNHACRHLCRVAYGEAAPCS